MPAVDVNLISTVGRIRSLNDAQVQALVDSIDEVGLLNPVTVYRTTIYRSGEPVDGFGLVAGAHRLEATKRLGLAEIEVTVVDLDEPHRVLAECDENLCSTTLTPAERAEFTSRRKWAYEQLHPETAHGVIGNGREKSRQVGDSTPRFTTDTAAKTGQSERKVQRDAERGEKVSNAALALVKGSPRLNTGAYLDKLKGMSPSDQVEKVRADLATPPAPKRQAPVDDDDVVERQVDALMAAWNKAVKEARDEFLDRIAAPRTYREAI